jgi:methyl-accepting chemotaxis protein
MLIAHLITSGLWLQESDSLSAGNTKLLMIFIGIVAFSSLAQACIFIGMAVGAAKAQKKVLGLVQELHGKSMPAISSVQELIREATPKFKVITDNLVETSHVVRAKAQELDVTLTDVNKKTRSQIAEVDGMITSTLKAANEIVATVNHSIRVPVREVAGMVNGLKAGLDVLIGRAKGFGSSIPAAKGPSPSAPKSPNAFSTLSRPATKTGGDSDLVL